MFFYCAGEKKTKNNDLTGEKIWEAGKNFMKEANNEWCPLYQKLFETNGLYPTGTFHFYFMFTQSICSTARPFIITPSGTTKELLIELLKLMIYTLNRLRYYEQALKKLLADNKDLPRTAEIESHEAMIVLLKQRIEKKKPLKELPENWNINMIEPFFHAWLSFGPVGTNHPSLKSLVNIVHRQPALALSSSSSNPPNTPESSQEQSSIIFKPESVNPSMLALHFQYKKCFVCLFCLPLTHKHTLLSR